MAGTDDDILVKIGLDLSSLKENFFDVSKEFKNAQSEADKTNKVIKEITDTFSQQSRAVKETITSNVSAIANQTKAIDASQKQIKKSIDETSKSLKNSEISKYANDVEGYLNKLNELSDINLSFDDKELMKIQKALEESSGDIEVLISLFDILINKLESVDQTESVTALSTEFKALKTYYEEVVNQNEILESSVKSSATSFDDLNSKIAITEAKLNEAKEAYDNIGRAIEDFGNTNGSASAYFELKEMQGAAAKEVEKYTKELEEQNKELDKLNTSQKSHSTELRNVKNELVALEIEGKRGSERYEDLRRKAEEYQSAITNANAELRRSISSTRGLDQVLGALTGIVGALTAAQGAAALFGNENEDVAKSLVKLNGAIALLNGLQATQNELTKQGSVLNRAYVWTQNQLTIATDGTAKATTRLAAATKLLGIGLLIGLVAALATNWNKVKKAIGLSTDETERNQKISKKANETYGEQIAKFQLLSREVEKGGKTFEQKKETVKKYNDEFGNTLGKVKTYSELENKLIANGPNYVKYLQMKAKAEASYQLVLERQKRLLEQITALETGDLKWYEQLQDISDKVFEGIWRFAGVDIGESRHNITNEEMQYLLGLPDGKQLDEALSKYSSVYQQSIREFRKEQSKINKEYDKSSAMFGETAKLAEELAIEIVNEKDLKSQKDLLEKYTKLMNDLVKKEEATRIGALENARQKEVESLKHTLEEDKKAYELEIKNLEIAESKKAKLREQFNKIYNKENGTAYEQLRKDIAEVDRKYDKQIEDTRLKAVQAIDVTYNRFSEAQISKIKQDWEKVREELQNQMKLTADVSKIAELEKLITESKKAEATEIQKFTTAFNLDRLDVEKQMADSVLKIYQSNTKYIIDDEAYRQSMLLEMERQYQQKKLEIIRQSMTEDNKGQFDGMIDSIMSSTDPGEVLRISKEMKAAFGEEMANEILRTVAALQEVNNSINEVSVNDGLKRSMSDLEKWTNNLDSFSKELAKSLNLTGAKADEFAKSISTAINTIWSSMSTIFEAQVKEHEDRVRRIDEAINEQQKKVDEEKELQEQGLVNNYDIRQKELEQLQEQKAKEEEELERAMAKKEAMAKVEMALQTVNQATSLVTASANILEWTSGIPFVGQALGIALIAAMWTTFAAAKAKSFEMTSGSKYRTGLRKGAVELNGPSHENGGFQVVNSRTGRAVAEFEGGEDVYVFNREQKRNYGHIMKALIDDAQGKGRLDDVLHSMYGIQDMSQGSKDRIRVINSVNVLTKESKENRAKESKDESASVLREMIRLQERDRSERVEFWETPEFYFVKQGKVIKKYKKL
ncbi:hypothetical protein ACPDHQ_07360 [Myroides odoratimimus]|uniref:hypothetical protein n=1 Tax=Myroides odoratimimus TaxID=76832 RepID=UPI003D2F63DD